MAESSEMQVAKGDPKFTELTRARTNICRFQPRKGYGSGADSGAISRSCLFFDQFLSPLEQRP